MKKEMFERAMQNIDDTLIEEADAVRNSSVGSSDARQAQKGRGRIRTSRFSGMPLIIAALVAGVVVTVALIAVNNIRRGKSGLSEQGNASGAPTEPAATGASDSPVTTGQITVWNGFRFPAETYPVLPDLEVARSINGENDIYKGQPRYFCSLDDQREEAFYDKLKAAGYTVFKTSWGAFIYSDNCLIIQTGTPRSDAQADAGTEYTPEPGMKTAILNYYFRDNAYESAQVLSGGTTPVGASEALAGVGANIFTEALPIDVTPEGFFEASGGQIFLVPVKHYGEADKTQVSSVYPVFYYIHHGRAEITGLYGETRIFMAPLDSVAMADIDADGKREVLLIGYGPTSGVASYTFHAFYDGVEKYSSFITTQNHGTPSFTESEGRLKVAMDEYVSFQERKTVLFDIGLKNDSIVLSDGTRTYGDPGGADVPVVTAAPPEPTGTPTQAPPTDYPDEKAVPVTGYFKLIRHTRITKTLMRIYNAYGLSMFIVLDEEGKGFINNLGTEYDLEWRDGDLYADGSKINYSYDKETQILTFKAPTGDEGQYRRSEEPAPGKGERAVINKYTGKYNTPYKYIDDITFEGKNVIDNEKVRFEVSRIWLNENGTYTIGYSVENKTDEVICYELKNIAVNGAALSLLFGENSVSPGSKKTEEIHLYGQYSHMVLIENGMADPTIISFDLTLYDERPYIDHNPEKLLFGGRVDIYPLGEDRAQLYEFRPEGSVLLEDNDFYSLYLTGFTTDDYSFGNNTPTLHLVLINKTEETLNMAGENLTVNGVSIFSGLESDNLGVPVVPSRFAPGAIHLFTLGWSLEENVFPSLDSLEIGLVLFDRYGSPGAKVVRRDRVEVSFGE